MVLAWCTQKAASLALPKGALLLAPLFILRQTLGFLSSALPRHCAVILHGLAPRMSLSESWAQRGDRLVQNRKGAESEAHSSRVRKVVSWLFSGVKIIKQGFYPCYHSTHLKTLIQILHE